MAKCLTEKTHTHTHKKIYADKFTSVYRYIFMLYMIVYPLDGKTRTVYYYMFYTVIFIIPAVCVKCTYETLFSFSFFFRLSFIVYPCRSLVYLCTYHVFTKIFSLTLLENMFFIYYVYR